MPSDDVLTAAKFREYCDRVAASFEHQPTGDDAIRQLIRSMVVHPREKERTEKMLDEVFGKRWRDL